MTIENDDRVAYDSAMETRLARIEVAVEYMQRDIKELKDDVRGIHAQLNGIRTTDFRILFGALITVALGLSGVMAKGFGWL